MKKLTTVLLVLFALNMSAQSIGGMSPLRLMNGAEKKGLIGFNCSEEFELATMIVYHVDIGCTEKGASMAILLEDNNVINLQILEDACNSTVALVFDEKQNTIEQLRWLSKYAPDVLLVETKKQIFEYRFTQFERTQLKLYANIFLSKIGA